MLSLVLIAPADYLIVNVLNYESVANLVSISTKEIGKENIYKVVIIFPLIEEILFRLFLKPTKFTISMFSLFFTFYMLNRNFTHIYYSGLEFYVKLFIASIVAILFYLKCDYYIPFIEKNNKYFIIISIVVFGLAHISNIKSLHFQLMLFYPIFVIPQMIIGYFITNARLKLGFFWGILLHCLVNLINVYI